MSSLADIGIGVFKVRNMNNAEIKIEDLRSKTNVLNITYLLFCLKIILNMGFSQKQVLKSIYHPYQITLK